MKTYIIPEKALLELINDQNHLNYLKACGVDNFDCGGIEFPEELEVVGDLYPELPTKISIYRDDILDEWDPTELDVLSIRLGDQDFTFYYPQCFYSIRYAVIDINGDVRVASDQQEGGPILNIHGYWYAGDEDICIGKCENSELFSTCIDLTNR